MDLELLRQQIIENLQNKESKPNDPQKKILVDKKGKVHLGSDDGTGGQLTEVTQDTFKTIG